MDALLADPDTRDMMDWLLYPMLGFSLAQVAWQIKYWKEERQRRKALPQQHKRT